MEEHGKIKKGPKGPEITSLRYRWKRQGMHIDISNKYNSKNKVILLEISSYRTDIYRNKNGLYKFVTIRYADFFKDSQGYYIDKELYKSKLQDKKIDKNYEFMLVCIETKYCH